MRAIIAHYYGYICSLKQKINKKLSEEKENIWGLGAGHAGQAVCKPGSVPCDCLRKKSWGGDHSSGALVAQSPQCDLPERRPEDGACRTPAMSENTARAGGRSYLVLLPVGFTVPVLLPAPRWALTATLSPLPRSCRGGFLSVALSLRSPSPAVSRHRVSVKPGLSSPGPKTQSGRPTA